MPKPNQTVAIAFRLGRYLGRQNYRLTLFSFSPLFIKLIHECCIEVMKLEWTAQATRGHSLLVERAAKLRKMVTASGGDNITGRAANCHALTRRLTQFKLFTHHTTRVFSHTVKNKFITDNVGGTWRFQRWDILSIRASSTLAIWHTSQKIHKVFTSLVAVCPFNGSLCVPVIWVSVRVCCICVSGLDSLVNLFKPARPVQVD